jgi:flagellar protein FliO/FliZ
MIRPCLFVAFVVLLPLAGTASTAVGSDASTVIFPKATASTAPAAEPGSSAGFSTVVGALILAAGGVWFLLRSRAAKANTGTSMASLKIEETKPLGNRQFLVVASYEGQKFLLGVVPGRVDFLSALKAEEGTGKTTR